jgi:hypothetical protein
MAPKAEIEKAESRNETWQSRKLKFGKLKSISVF